jgi:flagellar basal-body rod modification protein FlgD
MTTSVNPTTAGSARSAAVSSLAAATAKNQIGSTQFLQLMTTQLKNQDPMKPLDSTQFVSQLAQMTEVSSLQEMQTSLSSLAGSLGASQLLGAAGLVGHMVLAPGSSVTLGTSGVAGGAVSVPTGTTALQLNVLDSAGALVRSQSLTPGSGQQLFSWDGNTDSGTRAVPGNYTFQVLASSGSGQATSLATQVATQVSSVSIDSSTNAITLNTPDLGALKFSDVSQVF